MLGVGGMATVYRAESAEHGVVALKILHPGKADTEEERRFKREFLTLRDLDHPGIVRVIEAGRHGAYPWIAMEYVDGTDLGTVLDGWKSDPPAGRFAKVEAIFRALTAALAYVHERGLIHRDLKPSNVLVTADGRPKLTDFGVVKAQGGMFSTQLTMAGRLVGTVAFMAPEQIMAEGVDARADLYSLGACLYLMLTGERPIVADNIAGYLARHLTHTPKAPSEIDPRVPAHLERIAMRLLRKDASQRYASARQVLAALDQEERPERSPLHGREAELVRLLGRIEGLPTLGGGVIVLEGDPGVGRSSLLAELVDQARQSGHDVASSAADAGVIDRLAAQVPVAADLPNQSGAALLSARTRGRPWTLVVDDLDRVGGADRDALTELVRQAVAIEGEPLLVITAVASREGDVAAFCTGAATGLSPDVLELGPLDRKSVIALVRDRGVGGAAGVTLGARLHDELGGLPGLVVEHIAALIRAGWLVRDEDEQGLRATRGLDALREEPLPVPDRVLHEEAARLVGLDPDSRKIWDAVVVLAMEVTADLIADTAGLDMGTVERSVALLGEEGLVRTWVEGVQELVALGRPGQRELFYGLIEPEQRIALHRGAAAALRRRARRRAGAWSELIAHHLQRGGQVAEAWPLLIDATRRKLRTDEVPEAHRLLRQALDAGPAAEPRLPPVEARKLRGQLHALEGEVLERSGELTGALGSWERAFDWASGEGDAEGMTRAQAGIGLVRAARGDGDGAVAALDPTITALPPGDPLWPRVAVTLMLARLHRGQLAGARDLLDALERLGEQTGSRALQADAALGRAAAAQIEGDLAQARNILEAAEDRLREQTGGAPLGRLLIHQADLALVDGRLVEAAERAGEAERLLRAAGAPTWALRGLAISVEAHALRGDRDEASRSAELATYGARPFAQASMNGQELLAVVLVARALCLADRPDEAAGLLREPPGVGRMLLEDPLTAHAAVRARALSASDPRRAIKAAQSALFRPPAPLPAFAARASLDLGQALRKAGDPAAVSVSRDALHRTTLPGLRQLRLEALRLALRFEADPAWRAEADALKLELGRGA
jgi:tetratricopeptide (TPR) repeat protein